MTTITADQVRAATKERCYDHGVIAMALNDPAIQQLVVEHLAEAANTRNDELGVIIEGSSLWLEPRDIIAALCPPLPPRTP